MNEVWKIIKKVFIIWYIIWCTLVGIFILGRALGFWG